MGKKLVILFLVCLMFFGLFVSGSVNSSNVSEEVTESLENRSKVRVTIEIEEPGVGISTQSVSSAKSEVKKDILGERHDFGDKISAEISKAELNKLKNNPSIKGISKVKKKGLFLSESKDVINTSSTWNVNDFSGTNLTGKHESVCILDTGADTNHPDLKGQNGTCVIDCTGSSCVEDCSVQDYDGHGSHMAGIITGNGSVKGVARGADYIPVKVCTKGSGCFNDDIKAGVDWCKNNKDTYNISVASMSLGSTTLYRGYCDDASDGDGSHGESVNLTGSIKEATDNNVSVIVSTGNDANYTHTANPSCVESAVSVADTYDSDVGGLTWGSGLCTDSSTSKDKVVCHANRNNVTDLFAPGALINSTWKDGSYAEKGGTSMATPHVAGAYAIINQYKRLESSTVLNTSKIKSSLNDTGKRISDSDSGLDFSRIDIYSSLLDLDEKAPSINLTSPDDSYSTTSSNLTLKCNASDELQLKNLTLKTWNSTSLMNKTSVNATNNSVETNMSLNNLERGDYEWNCVSYDEKNNSNTKDSNYTFSVSELATTLDSPKNNSYTNSNSTNFSCTGKTHRDFELVNSTFNLWNSSGLEYNETKNLTGNDNQTTYSYNLTNETSYSWNCLSYNNNTNSTIADSNYTVNYDVTKPNVTSVSPDDGHSVSGSETIIFKYNASESNLDSCSLIIDGTTEKTNSSVNTSKTNSFSKSLSTGSYNWKVSCTDLAGNSNETSTRSLTLESTSSNGGGSGGGGGGGSSGGSSSSGTEEKDPSKERSPETYQLSQSEIKEGKVQKMSEKDTTFFEVKSKSHSMKVNNLSSESANITVKSEPINLVLEVNESEKINFDSDGFFDLLVKLESIENESANIMLKEINESIGKKFPHSNESKNNSNEEDFEKIEQGKSLWDKNKWHILSAAFIVILIIVYYITRKYKDKIDRDTFDFLKGFNYCF